MDQPTTDQDELERESERGATDRRWGQVLIGQTVLVYRGIELYTYACNRCSELL